MPNTEHPTAAGAGLIVGSPPGTVHVGGEALDLAASLALRNHSPTGFAWGYEGSGPAQLALALLLYAGANEGEALDWYQAFKREVVAGWPAHEPFAWPVSGLDAWIAERRAGA